MSHDQQRRRIVTGSAALAMSAWGSTIAATLTPPQTAGPFYPDVMPEDDDSDLTRVRGADTEARGEITALTGRVLDTNGKPIPNARVEIWQCDVNGRYRHSRERTSRQVDPGFQGFGHSITDADGGYHFRTIKPVPYPGRTPHIHYLVLIPGEGYLVTQLYVEGDARNAGDFLFNRLSEEARSAVSVPFTHDPQSGVLHAEFDVILGLENITPV
jgi:protocatechuate 3,4-dioxygenase, beta subunit